MNPNLLRKHTGLLPAVAVCWVIFGAAALGLLPVGGLPGMALAQSTTATTAEGDAAATTADTAQAAPQEGETSDDPGADTATQAEAAPTDTASDTATDTASDTATDTAGDAVAESPPETATAGEQQSPADQATDAPADGTSDVAGNGTDTAAEPVEPPDATPSAAGDGSQTQPADAAAQAPAGDEEPQATPPATAPPAASTAPTQTTGQDTLPSSGGSATTGSATTGSKATTASSAAMPAMGGDIRWGQDYRAWEQTTGFVSSAAHGNRLLVTYVTPPEAAKIYRGNAALVRNNRKSGFQPYPRGTQIVAESFRKGAQGKPGQRDPLFFMKKDAAGGDWTFAFTDPAFRLLGEGTTGRVAFCQACHLNAAPRDAVFAIDR